VQLCLEPDAGPVLDIGTETFEINKSTCVKFLGLLLLSVLINVPKGGGRLHTGDSIFLPFDCDQGMEKNEVMNSRWIEG